MAGEFSKEWQKRIYQLPPIENYFVVTNPSTGEEPVSVSEGWLHLVLPVRFPRSAESPQSAKAHDLVTREERYLEDSVRILVGDALAALEEANRPETFAFIEGCYKNYPMLVLMAVSLYFSPEEGLLLSPVARERYFPEAS